MDVPIQNLKLDSLKLLLKAQCYEAQENKLYAVNCFIECLKKDPTCIEAFNRLIDCYLLTNPESKFHLFLLLTSSMIRGTAFKFTKFQS